MDPSQIKALIDAARQAMREGEVVRAIAMTDQLASIAPDDPAVRTLRAEALLHTGAVDDAVDEARRAVELDATSDRAHTMLWLAAWRGGRLSLAQESLERAIEISGRRPGLLVDYAWFMAYERGPRLALQAANEAIEANPKSSTAWAALGLAQYRLHRRRAAEASVTHAIEFDPSDPYAQSVMLKLLHDGRDRKGTEALAQKLESIPGTEDIVSKVRQEAKARQVAKKLVERNASAGSERDSRRERLPYVLFITLILAGGLGALAVAILVFWKRFGF